MQQQRPGAKPPHIAAACLQALDTARTSENNAALALQDTRGRLHAAQTKLGNDQHSADEAVTAALRADAAAESLRHTGELDAAAAQSVVASQMHSKARELQQAATSGGIACEALSAEESTMTAAHNAAQCSLQRADAVYALAAELADAYEAVRAAAAAADQQHIAADAASAAVQLARGAWGQLCRDVGFLIEKAQLAETAGDGKSASRFRDDAQRLQSDCSREQALQAAQQTNAAEQQYLRQQQAALSARLQHLRTLQDLYALDAAQRRDCEQHKDRLHTMDELDHEAAQLAEVIAQLQAEAEDAATCEAAARARAESLQAAGQADAASVALQDADMWAETCAKARVAEASANEHAATLQAELESVQADLQRLRTVRSRADEARELRNALVDATRIVAQATNDIGPVPCGSNRTASKTGLVNEAAEEAMNLQAPNEQLGSAGSLAAAQVQELGAALVHLDCLHALQDKLASSREGGTAAASCTNVPCTATANRSRDGEILTANGSSAASSSGVHAVVRGGISSEAPMPALSSNSRGSCARQHSQLSTEELIEQEALEQRRRAAKLLRELADLHEHARIVEQRVAEQQGVLTKQKEAAAKQQRLAQATTEELAAAQAALTAAENEDVSLLTQACFHVDKLRWERRLPVYETRPVHC